MEKVWASRDVVYNDYVGEAVVNLWWEEPEFEHEDDKTGFYHHKQMRNDYFLEMSHAQFKKLTGHDIEAGHRIICNFGLELMI